MLTLFKKELEFYLNNTVGYIVVILFAVFANFLFIKDIFVIGSASMRPFFNILPWLFLVFVPALTMRIFAEEKRTNTIERLLTLPVSETQIVVAKFLALFTILVLALLLTFSIPISLSFLTKIYFPEIIVGYVGSLFVGAFFIVLSMFFSSETSNQVVSFLISALVLFFLMVLSSDFVGSVLPRFLQNFFSYFTPLYHFQNFTKGIVDIRSLFYFVSFTVLFLFLTIVNLERRV